MHADTFMFIALELFAVLGVALFLGTIALLAERGPES
jgi:nitrate reductase NapE component